MGMRLKLEATQGQLQSLARSLQDHVRYVVTGVDDHQDGSFLTLQRESELRADLARGNKTYLAILEYMQRLHVAKAAGYSGTETEDTWLNFREAERLGLTPIEGVMIRLSDKWMRICNLFRNPSNDKLNGENLIRTHIDAASYHIIAACLLSEADPQALIEATSEVK